MANDLDDLMGSLRNEGYLKGGGKGGEVTPSSSSADDSGDESFLKSTAMAPLRFGEGALRGAAGQVVGAGQLASGLEEKVLGTHALSTIGEHIPGGEWLREQTTRPSSGFWESAGNVAGSTLPWLLTPEVAAASRLGRILGYAPKWIRGAAGGAGIGAVQPTQSGTLESHVPGAILGGVGGATLSHFGGAAARQAALKDFNSKALNAIVEPFAKHWPADNPMPPIQNIGSEGVAEVRNMLQRAGSTIGKHRADIPEVQERLDRFLDAADSNYHVDPQSLTEHFNKTAPGTPPGHVRFYHGGADPASGGKRWVSQDQTYAKNYRPGQPLHYVDIPQQWLDKKFPDTDLYTGRYARPYPHFEVPEKFARQMRPVDPRVTSHPLKDLAEQGRRGGVPPLRPTGAIRGGMAHTLAYPLNWLLRGSGIHIPHAGISTALHALARQSAGRSTMDELNWLARNAKYLTRATPVIAGEAGTLADQGNAQEEY
jgi:hypothetical protein